MKNVAKYYDAELEIIGHFKAKDVTPHRRKPVVRSKYFYMLPDREHVTDYCLDWQYVVVTYPATAVKRDKFHNLIIDFTSYKLYGFNTAQEVDDFKYWVNMGRHYCCRVIQMLHGSDYEYDILNYYDENVYPEGYTGPIVEQRWVQIAEAKGE